MFALDSSRLTPSESDSQIKWLKRELERSRSKEEASREQLNTNSHMLAAFQQSIENLTSRLELETRRAESRERELEQLRPKAPSGNGGPRVGSSNGHSYHSDYSDCETDNSPFDRKKSTRRSWKGSLTRAFSRSKKTPWTEEDWSPQPHHVHQTSEVGVIHHPHMTVTSPTSTTACPNCERLESRLSELSGEVQELKRPKQQNSLINYIRDEQSEKQVLYRIAVIMRCHNTRYTIGSVGITELTGWRELDSLVLSCMAKHLQLIDPGKQLGLKTSSILNYEFDSVVRRPSSSEEEATADVREMRGAITVNLRSGGNCDSISYDSLLPLSFLKIAQNALRVEHFICITGPRFSGKSYTAELLARNLLSELRPPESTGGGGGGGVANVVLYESGELQDADALKRFQTRMSSSSIPVVAIVSDYTTTKFDSETIKFLRDSPGFKHSYVILLTEDARPHTLDTRVVRCSVQCEPFASLLDRHYNRLLSIQPADKRPGLRHVFTWLVSVWRHVNDTLMQHVDGQCLIGPTQFMGCPAEVDEAEEWFLSLWNMVLTPHLIATVQEGLQQYGRKHAGWQDPVDFIKGSYPWTSSREFCDLLQGIHASELNFDSFRSGPLIGGNAVLTQDQMDEVIRCVREHLPVVARDPVPPARTTSVLSSGSDENNTSRHDTLQRRIASYREIPEKLQRNGPTRQSLPAHMRSRVNCYK